MMRRPQHHVDTPVMDRVAVAILCAGPKVPFWDVTAEEYETISRELKAHRKRTRQPLLCGPDHGGLLLCGVELRVLP